MIAGLERKIMKLLVLFSDTIYKIPFFCPDENWINK